MIRDWRSCAGGNNVLRHPYVISQLIVSQDSHLPRFRRSHDHMEDIQNKLAQFEMEVANAS